VHKKSASKKFGVISANKAIQTSKFHN